MNNIADLHEVYIKYKMLYDRYLIEINRKSNIESKAVCVIGFVSVVLVLSVNLYIHNLDKIGYYQYILWLVIPFGLTYRGLYKTLFKGDSEIMALSPDYIMLSCNPKNTDAIMTLCEELYDITRFNAIINSRKSVSLMFSIGVFVFTCGILIALIFSGYIEQPIRGNNNTNHSDNLSMITNVQTSILKSNSTTCESFDNVANFTICDSIYKRKLNLSENRINGNS